MLQKFALTIIIAVIFALNNNGVVQITGQALGLTNTETAHACSSEGIPSGGGC